MIPTTPENNALINTVYEKLQMTMENLASRWHDEHEYENINDYGNAIKSKLPKCMKFVKMSKKPFGFSFELDKKIYSIQISGNKYLWKRLS